MKLIALVLILAVCGCATQQPISSGYLGRYMGCVDGHLVQYFDDGTHTVVFDHKLQEMPCGR